MSAFKRICIALVVLCIPLMAAAQTVEPTKYALVIGNAQYTGQDMTPLKNPVNDAADMAATLTSLGFQVETVHNGSRGQMESAISRLKSKLSTSRNAYGFFYYAGHAVESKGQNYLIPVDAVLPSENYLRDRAVPLRTLLEELGGVGNELNVIILDSCRNNPFSWSRGGTRGLAVVDHTPSGSVVMYAAKAGQVAQDGEGRNGLFTGQLLKNLKTPGLELQEMIKRTGADVLRASGNVQSPEVRLQFFGDAYLGTRPNPGGVVDDPKQYKIPHHIPKSQWPAIDLITARANSDGSIETSWLGANIQPGWQYALYRDTQPLDREEALSEGKLISLMDHGAYFSYIHIATITEPGKYYYAVAIIDPDGYQYFIPRAGINYTSEPVQVVR